MQSDQTPSDSSEPRDSKSVAPKRHRSTNHGKRKTSEVPSNTGLKRKNDADGDDDSDVEYMNFDKLKKFHIPRKKGQDDTELLTELPLDAREYTRTIYPTFRSSFFDAQSRRKLIVNRVELVQNPELEKQYLAKKKDLKDEGRSEKDLTDSFGYVHFFKRSEVEKVCKNGLTVGHCNLASLGKPDMGVYVCKHADIVRFSKWEDQQSGYIVMFKIMKGKTKLVAEGRTPFTEQEPTPLCDCHITKIPIDVAQNAHNRAYMAFQYYFYEYGDVDVVQRPRQVLPYSVLQYVYEEAPNSVVPGSRAARRESSLDDVFADAVGYTPFATTSSSDNGFCHWRGKLLVKNGTFCSIELRSHLDTVFNVANIDRSVNVKACLSLGKLKRQLPPTLMSRSAKKYNVIYRGRTYNTFTLHPAEEGSGLGKFRQLVGHLVQRTAAAFVPLRNNSSLYLLPLSGLTEEMGLRSSAAEPATPNGAKRDKRNARNFLHVITITPKALSSKINDQRVFNIIHNRKRKDSSSGGISPSFVHSALEQKLRQMNIDPSSTLSAMDPVQHQKIHHRLKDKKKLLTSEKMLHSHYKEADFLPSLAKAVYVKKIATKWTEFSSLQQEFYATKNKSKVPQSPSNARHRSLSRNSAESIDVVAPMEDSTDATFSDDEDAALKLAVDAYKIPKKSTIEKPAKDPEAPVPPSRSSADPRMDPLKKSHPTFQYTPSPTVTAGSSPVRRPSFKPLEDLLSSGNLEELFKHPDFSFSERHASAHKVSGVAQTIHADTSYGPWDEERPRISVSFTQTPPYHVEGADCPYAFDNDPVVLSMLRAIHGSYDETDDATEDQDKVRWVRKILHSDESVTTNGGPSESHVPGQTQAPARKIVEHSGDKPQSHIPEVSPHQSSTDSGFVSSSLAGNTDKPDNSSLKDIAAIIASALAQQAKVAAVQAVLKETSPSANQSLASPSMGLSSVLKAFNQSDGSEKSDANSEERLDGIDMEIGSTPEQSPAREEGSLPTGPDLFSGTLLRRESLTPPPIPGASTQHPQGPASMDPWDRPITPPPAPPSFASPGQITDTSRSRDLSHSPQSHPRSHERQIGGGSDSRGPSRYEDGVQDEVWGQEPAEWQKGRASSHHAAYRPRDHRRENGGNSAMLSKRDWPRKSRENDYYSDDWPENRIRDGWNGKDCGEGDAHARPGYRHRGSIPERDHYDEPYRSHSYERDWAERHSRKSEGPGRRPWGTHNHHPISNEDNYYAEEVPSLLQRRRPVGGIPKDSGRDADFHSEDYYHRGAFSKRRPLQHPPERGNFHRHDSNPAPLDRPRHPQMAQPRPLLPHPGPGPLFRSRSRSNLPNARLRPSWR